MVRMKIFGRGKVKAPSSFRIGIGLLFLLLPLGAAAQNKTESITVTSPSDRARKETLRNFIRSIVVPSYDTRKLSRWTRPVCPLVIGLTPQQNAAVKERIKTDAQEVGAVGSREPCAPNVTVAFSLEPQNLMTQIAANPNLKGHLGDNDGAFHRRKLAKLVAPIQAWYGTSARDLRGFSGSWEMPNAQPSSPDGVSFCRPAACYVGQSSYLNDGIKSDLASVFVVVDLGKVDGRNTGTIADFVAMLALSQTNAFATCHGMPSITNLLVADCDAKLKTTALSEADRAFLRGVYKTVPGDQLNLAMGDIFREMEKSAVGQEAGKGRN